MLIVILMVITLMLILILILMTPALKLMLIHKILIIYKSNTSSNAPGTKTEISTGSRRPIRIKRERRWPSITWKVLQETE